MVTELKDIYQYDICKMHFKDKHWAEKCEAWCKNNNSCNLEVIKHAIDD